MIQNIIRNNTFSLNLSEYSSFNSNFLEFFVLFYGIILVVVLLFFWGKKLNLYTPFALSISIIFLMATCVLVNETIILQKSAFHSTINLNGNNFMCLFFKSVTCLFASIFFYILSNLLKNQNTNSAILIFLYFTFLGLLLLIGATDLISCYLSIELISLSSYLLAAYKKDSNYSLEAGLKYFIIGAVSSAFFLIGSALIYASSGSIVFPELHHLYSELNLEFTTWDIPEVDNYEISKISAELQKKYPFLVNTPYFLGLSLMEAEKKTGVPIWSAVGAETYIDLIKLLNSNTIFEKVSVCFKNCDYAKQQQTIYAHFKNCLKNLNSNFSYTQCDKATNKNLFFYELELDNSDLVNKIKEVGFNNPFNQKNVCTTFEISYLEKYFQSTDYTDSLYVKTLSDLEFVENVDRKKKEITARLGKKVLLHNKLFKEFLIEELLKDLLKYYNELQAFYEILEVKEIEGISNVVLKDYSFKTILEELNSSKAILNAKIRIEKRLEGLDLTDLKTQAQFVPKHIIHDKIADLRALQERINGSYEDLRNFIKESNKRVGLPEYWRSDIKTPRVKPILDEKKIYGKSFEVEPSNSYTIIRNELETRILEKQYEIYAIKDMLDLNSASKDSKLISSELKHIERNLLYQTKQLKYKLHYSEYFDESNEQVKRVKYLKTKKQELVLLQNFYNNLNYYSALNKASLKQLLSNLDLLETLDKKERLLNEKLKYCAKHMPLNAEKTYYWKKFHLENEEALKLAMYCQKLGLPYFFPEEEPHELTNFELKLLKMKNPKLASEIVSASRKAKLLKMWEEFADPYASIKKRFEIKQDKTTALIKWKISIVEELKQVKKEKLQLLEKLPHDVTLIPKPYSCILSSYQIN